jgi:hypothetical protein
MHWKDKERLDELEKRVAKLEAKAAFVKGFNRETKPKREEIYVGQLWQYERPGPSFGTWWRVTMVMGGKVQLQGTAYGCELRSLKVATLRRYYRPLKW